MPKAPLDQRVLAMAETVASLYGFSMKSLLSPSRHGEISRVRHLAIWLAAHCLGATRHGTGRALQRKHTSVIYAIRQLDQAHARGLIPTPDEVWQQIRRGKPVNLDFHRLGRKSKPEPAARQLELARQQAGWPG